MSRYRRFRLSAFGVRNPWCQVPSCSETGANNCWKHASFRVTYVYYAHMYEPTYTYIYIHVTSINMCIYTYYEYICIRKHVHVSPFLYVHVHIYVWVRVYVYLYEIGVIMSLLSFVASMEPGDLCHVRQGWRCLLLPRGVLARSFSSVPAAAIGKGCGTQKPRHLPVLVDGSTAVGYHTYLGHTGIQVLGSYDGHLYSFLRLLIINPKRSSNPRGSALGSELESFETISHCQ